jgi:hypothetical protein
MKGKGKRAYVPQACFVTVNIKLFDYKHWLKLRQQVTDANRNHYNLQQVLISWMPHKNQNTIAKL